MNTAHTEAVKQLYAKQITNEDDAVGKTVKDVFAHLGDEIIITFTDGTYINIESDVDFDCARPVVSSSMLELYLMEAVGLNSEDAEAEKEARRTARDARMEECDRREFEKLKRKFEPKEPT